MSGSSGWDWDWHFGLKSERIGWRRDCPVDSRVNDHVMRLRVTGFFFLGSSIQALLTQTQALMRQLKFKEWSLIIQTHCVKIDVYASQEHLDS